MINILYEYQREFPKRGPMGEITFNRMTSEQLVEYFEYIRIGIAQGEPSEYFEYAPMAFANQERAHMRDMRRLRHETVKSVGPPCIFCKSENTILRELQTRSGDEGMTLFVICQSCGRIQKIGG